MKTRLAFSIATAVEPDILIADEILAVGDMRFKKKCAAKMTAMLEDGTDPAVCIPQHSCCQEAV